MNNNSRMSKKRKRDDLSSEEEEDDQNKKRQHVGGNKTDLLAEEDFKNFDTDQIYQWARNNDVAHTPAIFIQRYTTTDLLSMTETDVRKLPARSKKKVSVRAAESLWKALSKVNKDTNPKTMLNTSNGATEVSKSQKTNAKEGGSHANQSTKLDHAPTVSEDDINLETKEGVLNWLRLVVKDKPKTPAVTDILSTIGANFPHCAPKETKQSLYRAAVSSHGAINFNKEMTLIPFINGSPGIGKTRMALESLNILRECASESTDPRDQSLKQLLTSDGCVMSYISFGTLFSLTPQDQIFWECDDCSGLLAIRVLWRYYLRDKYPKLEDLQVTKAMAQYLTLEALVDQLREVGVTYYVLAIDEMNMLHDSSPDRFRQVVTSVCTAMRKNIKNFFVVFAGAIHTLLRTIISKSFGIPVSICPSLFTLADVDRILTALAAQFEYLKDWQRAGTFRRCIADLSNPPRVFDFFMMEIDSEMTRHTSRNVFTLDYTTVMKSALKKANKKRPSGLDPADAKEMIYLSLMKRPVSIDYRLASGKSLEEYSQNGFVFFSNVGDESKMHVAVPYFYLYHWLQSSKAVFGTAESLFQFSWNDPTEVGPAAFERFNVKFTSFKLTLLNGEEEVPFGEDCSKYYVTPRVTEPAETDLLAYLLPSSSRPKSYWTSVSKNAMNTTGIDAFYWLSEKVIEFQQYQANELDSTNPTNLSQVDLDSEYNKAKSLFDKYLAPLNYQFVFGLISNRALAGKVQLKPNMYLVHQGNMEEYYGPSFASVAQIKAFRSVNINTDD